MKRRIAIPLINGFLSKHFGKAEYFEIIDTENAGIVSNSCIEAPVLDHGKLPMWLANKGITHVIAGGIGQKAITSLSEMNVEILYGVEPDAAEILVKKFLEKKLPSGINLCDH